MPAGSTAHPPPPPLPPRRSRLEQRRPAQAAPGMEQGLSGKCVEILEPVSLRVSGEVPAWLSGELLRNGPGQFDVRLDSGGVHTVPHW